MHVSNSNEIAYSFLLGKNRFFRGGKNRKEIQCRLKWKENEKWFARINSPDIFDGFDQDSDMASDIISGIIKAKRGSQCRLL